MELLYFIIKSLCNIHAYMKNMNLHTILESLISHQCDSNWVCFIPMSRNLATSYSWQEETYRKSVIDPQ